MTKKLSLAEAQQALSALQATRAAHIERGKQLPELRRNASYEAHVGGDPNARQALERRIEALEASLKAMQNVGTVAG